MWKLRKANCVRNQLLFIETQEFRNTESKNHKPRQGSNTDSPSYVYSETQSYLFNRAKRAVLSDGGHRSHVVHAGAAEFGVEGIFLGHIDGETGRVGMAGGHWETFGRATVDGAAGVDWNREEKQNE